MRDLQRVIGDETRSQILHHRGKLPDVVIACVGGGSNAIGMFHPFVDDPSVTLIGVEAAGDGVDTGKHSATLSSGSIGVLHGAKSYMLQDSHGQVTDAAYNEITASQTLNSHLRFCHRWLKHIPFLLDSIIPVLDHSTRI